MAVFFILAVIYQPMLIVIKEKMGNQAVLLININKDDIYYC